MALILSCLLFNKISPPGFSIQPCSLSNHKR
nr:MAG TPA: hypothetical protein [Caudoviricetes sp.]